MDKIDHLNRAFRAVEAFVARLSSGTFNGLFDIFRRKYTEHHRDSAGKRRLYNAL